VIPPDVVIDLGELPAVDIQLVLPDRVVHLHQAVGPARETARRLKRLSTKITAMTSRLIVLPALGEPTR
jgi:hypothetical protein